MGSKSFLGILAERGKPVVLPLGKRVERLADRAAGRLKDKQIQENKVPSPKIPFDAPGWYEMLQVKLSDVNIMWMMTMDISASPDYKTITIFVSEIADFLYEINGWLEHLVECQLPAKCIIANEHIFSADPLSEDRIEFRITNTSSKQKDSPVIMQVIVKRKQLVKQFAKSFSHLVKNNYIPPSHNRDSEEDPNNIKYGDLLARLRKS